MVLPLLKVVIVCFKMVSKPITGLLKEYIRHNFGKHRVFIYLGNKANALEMKVNRKMINPYASTDFVVKPLADDAAFNKGVDVFAEVSFLYGFILFLTIYEIRRAYISSAKSSARLKKIEDATITNERMIQELHLLINDNKAAIQSIANNVDLKVEDLDSKLDDINLKLEKLSRKIL